MASDSSLIYLAVGLLVGGIGIAAAVQNGRRMVAERDATLRDVRQTLDAERAKAEALQTALREATADQGRLQGMAAQLEEWKAAAQLHRQRAETLAVEVAQAQQEIASERRHHEEGLREKEAELARTLTAKEAHLQAILREKSEALAAEGRAKDAALAEQRRILADAERVLTEKFGAVSMESLKTATAQFLELATQRFEKVDEATRADLERRQTEIDQMLKPLTDSLEKLDRQHKEMEERRISAFDAIDKGIRTLSVEADQLANALRKPTSRGAWGEMQLQVILENAGMQEGEHFTLQHSTEGEEGRLRTDVVIRLPKGRVLVIDSKAPLETYWDGMNAPDEATRVAKFASHARLVRDHVRQLANKAYWSRYPSSPDCVVMFIPTEGAYQAAFEADRSLLAEAHKAGVYIANPMTLISMVHIAAYILNEEKLRESTEDVRAVGQELYKRLVKFLKEFDAMGKHLRMVVDDYNGAVASADRRLMPQVRRMAQLGAASKEVVPTLEALGNLPQTLTSPEIPALPSE